MMSEARRLNASIKVTMHVTLVGEHEEKLCLEKKPKGKGLGIPSHECYTEQYWPALEHVRR